MAIGRPISLTPNIATKAISSVATADQTEFTVTGGYRINEIAVYRNGVRLAEGRDFTASDGDTVNLVTGATVDDVIEFAVFDSFNVSDAIVSAASSQNLNGDFNVTGVLYAGDFTPDGLTVGVATVSTALHVGSALTSNAAGDLETVGIITAASFSGSGANLTGVATTDNIITGTAATFGPYAGVSAGVPNVNIAGLATVGIITAYGTGEFSSTLTVGGAGNFTSSIHVSGTTDSTSTSTGALKVDGGLGVAKNVYIGAGLSVAGTLTYEDVTSVDSVGLITAKSGVNITGGELTVGSGITMGIAGVATFSGTSDVHLHDNVQLNIGDGSDLIIRHDGSHSYIEDSGSGNLYIEASALNIMNAAGSENMAIFAQDGGCVLYNNNSQKFTTTNDGTVTTGISTVDGLRLGDLEYISVGAGSTGDLQLSHNGTDSIINNATGDLIIKGSGDDLILQAADNILIQPQTDEHGIIVYGDGGVALYYDASAKFETTNTGASITGVLIADGFTAYDNEHLKLGTNSDLDLFHSGTDSFIRSSINNLNINAGNSAGNVYINLNENVAGVTSERAASFNKNGSVDLYYDANKKFETTNNGVVVTGIATVSAGVAYTGLLREAFAKTDGKLSANTNIDLEDGMVHYFTTQETTTSTPNLRWNQSFSLNNKMNINDAITVTIITTAAAAGYSAQLTIDGGAVTEQWVGGDAPSAGGSDGYDIYTYNILKTASATFLVIGNLVNAT